MIAVFLAVAFYNNPQTAKVKPEIADFAEKTRFRQIETTYSESAMLALVMGARIAEDVFPEPIRSRIAGSLSNTFRLGR